MNITNSGILICKASNRLGIFMKRYTVLVAGMIMYNMCQCVYDCYHIFIYFWETKNKQIILNVFICTVNTYEMLWISMIFIKFQRWAVTN